MRISIGLGGLLRATSLLCLLASPTTQAHESNVELLQQLEFLQQQIDELKSKLDQTHIQGNETEAKVEAGMVEARQSWEIKAEATLLTARKAWKAEEAERIAALKSETNASNDKQREQELADRIAAPAADLFYGFLLKNAEGAGYDKQSIEAGKAGAAAEKTAKIFYYLEYDDRFKRQPHTGHAAVFDGAAVNDPDDAAGGDDGFGVFLYGPHDAQKSLFFNKRV